MDQTIEPSVLYFGTPVVLLSTCNSDGTSNVTPISSAWALDDTYALGLGMTGQAFANLCRLGELVINLAEEQLVDAIERIAPTTGSHPVPIEKQDRYRHEKDKWAVAGFTPVASALVSPHRIAECGIQMEARVSSMSVWGEDGVAVFARVLRVHAREDLVIPGTSYVDLQRWRPLYYTFRHYFGQGRELGRTFKAEW